MRVSLMVAALRRRACYGAMGLILVLCTCGHSLAGQLQFVYTSDQHYGFSRKHFQGNTTVRGTDVNAALVEAINSLGRAVFPGDGGVRAAEPVVWADFVISTGDIANRMDGKNPATVSTAAQCWEDFATQYLQGITLTRRDGSPAEVLVVPGNHDLTNALGHYKPMTPARDPSSMVAMFNRATGEHRTPQTFDPARDRVTLRRDAAGVRLLLIQMWPDSAMRQWLAANMPTPKEKTPVLLFAHAQPDVETRFFINPNGPGGAGDINPRDKFANLLSDISPVKSVDQRPEAALRVMAAFFHKHPVAAWFHGHENYTEFYTYTGPDNTLALPVFRVDSPMKGRRSAVDEAKLSFLVGSLDTDTARLTVREVLWNSNPADPGLAWGASRTIPLLP